MKPPLLLLLQLQQSSRVDDREQVSLEVSLALAHTYAGSQTGCLLDCYESRDAVQCERKLHVARAAVPIARKRTAFCGADL